jgi:hypothetical protein
LTRWRQVARVTSNWQSDLEEAVVKVNRSTGIWGLLLIVAGVLLLFGNFGWLRTIVPIIWAGLFALAGAAFLYVYVTDTERWWASIPGCVLLGLGSLIAISEVFPRLGGYVAGPLFLGAVSLSFWAIYLRKREMWWAIIPGGTMLTVAGITLLEELNLGLDTGGLVLLGISATFVGVSTVKVDGARMRWPLIPAAVMGVLGLFVMAESFRFLGYVWPLALVLVGVYFVLRSTLRQNGAHE